MCVTPRNTHYPISALELHFPPLSPTSLHTIGGAPHGVKRSERSFSLSLRNLGGPNEGSGLSFRRPAKTPPETWRYGGFPQRNANCRGEDAETRCLFPGTGHLAPGAGSRPDSNGGRVSRIKEGRTGSRPVSRVLSRTAIPLGCASPHTSSDLPGSRAGNTNAPLFGLAPGGVYRAAECCHPRGALLPHLFTLTCAPACRGHRRSVLCGTFRRLTPPRRYLAPCPVEPGLSSAPAWVPRPSGRLPERT